MNNLLIDIAAVRRSAQTEEHDNIRRGQSFPIPFHGVVCYNTTRRGHSQPDPANLNFARIRYAYNHALPH